MAKSHRQKRLDARYGKKKPSVSSQTISHKSHTSHSPKSERLTFLEKNSKQLLLIPFILLLIAIISIGAQYATTGDFINKGISLKGGSTFTVTNDLESGVDVNAVDTNALAQTLQSNFAGSDIIVRTQRSVSEVTAIIIEVDISDEATLTSFISVLANEIDGLTPQLLTQNLQTSSAVLGDAFFSQVLIALLVAFVLMGIVVFIQFRVPVPSLAVILAAFSDIVVTLAVVNVLGIKLSTAGIAAFLMLIGYSVDTDILLSTRVLKSKEGTVNERIRSAMKTGLTMNLTTLGAVVIALIFTKSQVIAQIMTILTIGLVIDMINTWIQNAGILRWYMQKRGDKQ